MEEIKWQAPEFEYYPKDILWYWMTIFIAIVILALAIWQKNFLFAVFIIIGEILILIWGSAEPKILDFEINDDGIFVGENKFYEWDKISGFSLRQSVLENFAVLKLELKHNWWGSIFVIFPENLIGGIRKTFKDKNIEELAYEEHFFDSLSRIFRF